MSKNIAVLDENNVVTGVYVVEDDYVAPEGITAFETNRANIGDVYDPSRYPTTGFANDEPQPEPAPESASWQIRLDKLEKQVADLMRAKS